MNDMWINRLAEWDASGRPEILPNCPKCGNQTMRHWDAWLVTGESCETEGCGFSSSEGSGCLL